jgi:hypothetical protein
MHSDLYILKSTVHEAIVEALARAAVEKGKTVSYRGAVALGEGLIAALDLKPGARVSLTRDE